MILDGRPDPYRVTYDPAFLSEPEADALLSWMLRTAPWQQEQVTMYGKTHIVRRQSCAFGPGITYKYSGVTRVGAPWPDVIKWALNRVSAHGRFNFALCNLYPDGEAKLGAHADDEPEILPDTTIIGISLGSARDFILSDTSGTRAKVNLAHGSAIFMEGACQRFLKHAVPARAKVHSPRVNITFRQMRG